MRVIGKSKRRLKFNPKIKAFEDHEQRFIADVHDNGLGRIQSIESNQTGNPRYMEVPSTEMGGYVNKHGEYIEHQVYSSALSMIRHHKETVPVYRTSLDLPGNPGLFTAGCEAEISFDRQFGTRMNSCHFEELCDQAGNKLYRLELVNSSEKPWHLRESTIQEWLSCTYKDANRLSIAWEALGLTKEMAIKQVNGYTNSQTLAWHTGIKGTVDKYIQSYEDLVSGMSDILESESLKHGIVDRDVESDEVYINDEECRYNELTHSDEWKQEVIKIFGDATQAHRDSVIAEINDSYIDTDKLEEEWWMEQDAEVVEVAFMKEDLRCNANPFTSKLLGTPEDNLSDKFINYLKRANRKQLTALTDLFITGEWKKDCKDPRWMKRDDGSKYKFDIRRVLTDSAISDFWKRVEARKDQLDKLRIVRANKAIETGLSEQVYETVIFASECASPKQAKHAITTQIFGGTFEFNGQRKKLITPTDPNEIELLWAIWKDEISL